MAESIGLWIRRQLWSREWTQADLARRMGTGTGAVSMWVTGKRIPDPATCDRLADVFVVPYEEVMRIAGHLPAREETDEGKDHLVELYRRLSPENRAHLVAVAEAMTQTAARLRDGVRGGV